MGTWPRAANGTLFLQLSKYALVGGTTDNAPRFYRIALDADGSIEPDQVIWGNDEIMPEGTVYRTTIFDSEGFIVLGPQSFSICGVSPLNLNELAIV